VTMIRDHIRPAVVLTLLLCVITGLLYPGAVTVVAELLFPRQAGGSLITRGGQVVGSRLIGQAFAAPYYFHSRPSVVSEDGAQKGHIPADMVTASASGLDPHISPANALLQVSRVARERGADPGAVRALVDRHTEGRQFGVLGEPAVNVLELNLAIDRAYPRPARP
jgi:K+-transporting ATPase ATPase C chain